jgi:hypothetical protein
VILRERPDGRISMQQQAVLVPRRSRLRTPSAQRPFSQLPAKNASSALANWAVRLAWTTANTTPSMRRSMLSTVEAYGGGTTETTMVKAPYTPIVHDAETTRVHSGSGVAASKAF